MTKLERAQQAAKFWRHVAQRILNQAYADANDVAPALREPTDEELRRGDYAEFMAKGQ